MEPYYRSNNDDYRALFGGKVAKISLDGGFTCPNRDGTIATGGCIFCSAAGSGDFAASRSLSIAEQIRQGKAQSAKKWNPVGYIAYFQAFTNTYAPVDVLRKRYEEALAQEDVVGLSIATRPDCLGEDVLALLEELNQRTALWVELGLQSANDDTAKRIHRGYKTAVFDEAVAALAKRNIRTVVHVILGLPGESKADMLATIQHINRLPVHGIKLQLLHILKGTALETLWKRGEVTAMEQETYINMLCLLLAHLRKDIVIHRLTGDAPRDLLCAPLWSLDKKRVRNALHQKLRNEHIFQGMALDDATMSK